MKVNPKAEIQERLFAWHAKDRLFGCENFHLPAMVSTKAKHLIKAFSRSSWRLCFWEL